MTSKSIQFYMSNKHRARMQNHPTSFFKSDPLKTTIIKNGLILPAHTNPAKLWADGGVLDKDGSFVEASGNSYLFGGKYQFDNDTIIKSDEEVVFFGPFISHWGHFICDLIGRMWYVNNNPKKYKIAYCGWNWHQGNGDLSGNYLELLELLGCKKEQFINIQKPTKFKKIIIPDLAFSGGNYYTAEFEQMIDTIVQNALKHNVKVPPKVYFSRTQFSNDKERGENKIEKIFNANHFKIVYPEKLSVKEQINYFNKSKEIAMVGGSISHNLMFARSKNTQAFILNKMDLVNNYQLVIDDMTKAKLVYIDAYLNIFQVLFGMGPFLISPTKHLKRFLKNHHYQAPGSNHVDIVDILWYLKKYYNTYSKPENKTLLKNQKASIKASNKDH